MCFLLMAEVTRGVVAGRHSAGVEAVGGVLVVLHDADDIWAA